MNPASTYYLSAPLHCDTEPMRAEAVGRRRRTTTPTSAATSVANAHASFGQHRLRATDAGRRRRERREDGARGSAFARRCDVNGVLRPVDRARVDRGHAARHGVGVRDARGATGSTRSRWRSRRWSSPKGQTDTEGRLGCARANAGDLAGRRLRGDEDPAGEHHFRAPASARTSASRRRARPARPRTTPTPGSAATRRNSRRRSGWAIQRGEIPMTERPRHLRRGRDVPGARSGVCSWRRRSRTSRRSDFLLPNTYPTYKDWHGEWQYSGGVVRPDARTTARR